VQGKTRESTGHRFQPVFGLFDEWPGVLLNAGTLGDDHHFEVLTQAAVRVAVSHGPMNKREPDVNGDPAVRMGKGRPWDPPVFRDNDL
jgi:hypothetical protein